MKIKTETRTVLQTDPFQIKIPEHLDHNFGGIAPITADGYRTFVLRLAFGFNGVEGFMPQLMADAGKFWWEPCLRITMLPGRIYQDSFLALHFQEMSTFCIDQPLVEIWELSHSGEVDFSSCPDWPRISFNKAVESSTDISDRMHLQGDYDGDTETQQNKEYLEKAWAILKEQFSIAFPLRGITDPATQIPGYKPEHHSVIFGE